MPGPLEIIPHIPGTFADNAYVEESQHSYCLLKNSHKLNCGQLEHSAWVPNTRTRIILSHLCECTEGRTVDEFWEQRFDAKDSAGAGPPTGNNNGACDTGENLPTLQREKRAASPLPSGTELPAQSDSNKTQQEMCPAVSIIPTRPGPDTFANAGPGTAPKQPMHDYIRLMALNVNGIRTPRKVLALGRFLANQQPQPDVCILTETHLFEWEHKKLHFPTYIIAHKSCRRPEDVQQACGGVAILTKKGLSHVQLNDLPQLKPPLNSCSIQIFPNTLNVEALRITGVYLQPAAKPKLQDVSCLTGAESSNFYKGKRVGHILGGDFNHPSWESNFEEWMGSHGIWTLTDPNCPTYASGNSLDTFLFAPGEEIPVTFLQEEPSHRDTDGQMVDCPHYPGETDEAECVGNHHPVYLNILTRKEKPPPFIRKMITGNICSSDWAERNDEVKRAMESSGNTYQLLCEENNATKLLEALHTIINKVAGDLYTRKPTHDKLHDSKLQDPYELLKEHHSKHPMLNQLRIAHLAGKKDRENYLINKIRRDGWHDYLSTIKSSNITAVYKMIRKKDGRADRTFTYPCAAPILQDSIYHHRPADKSAQLALYFEERLSRKPVNDEAQLNSLLLALIQDTEANAAQKHASNFALKRQPQGVFAEFREVEIIKAIEDLSKDKTPGADAIPAAIYKTLSWLTPLIRRLLTSMVRSGCVPKPLLEIIIVPIDKPGKNPHLCESKRPISLINVIMKVAEIAVYNRVIHTIEPDLDPAQHAYRRSRGTETHMAALCNTLQEALTTQKYAYVASLDISAAFDAAPHELLMGAYWATKADAFCGNFVETWLKERRFRVRLMTEKGPVLSPPKPIQSGLPQGGVLSPMLWNLFFNGIHESICQTFNQSEHAREHKVQLHIYIYADDIALVLTHPCPHILQQAAMALHEITINKLKNIGLHLSVPKCQNILMSPGGYVGDIFRRSPTMTQKARNEAEQRDNRLSTIAAMMGEAATEVGLCPEGIKDNLPYKYMKTIKLLGLQLDERLGFATHLAGILQKAIVRHGIMAQLASTTWGLEAGVLRSTHIALITSLIRYGFTTYGGHIYEKLMDRLDVQVSNIAARRITGVHKSARLEVLMPTAGLISARNMFIQQCGGMVIRALEAHNSPLHEWVQMQLTQVYKRDCWTTSEEALQPPHTLKTRVNLHGFVVHEYKDTWSIALLPTPVEHGIPDKYRVPSIFHTKADLITARPDLSGIFYNFENVQTWFDVGMQVLASIQWRPDCYKGTEINLHRLLPPIILATSPITVGSPTVCKWFTEREQIDLMDRLATATRKAEIQATFGRSGGHFYVAVCCHSDLHGTETHTSIIGTHEALFTPVYVRERVLEIALRTASTYAQRETSLLQKTQCLNVYIEDNMICNRLKDWLGRGAWRFETQAGEAVANLVHSLAKTLPFPLSIYTVAKISQLELPVFENPQDPSTVLYYSKKRAEQLLSSETLNDLKPRWTRIPLTKDEITNLITIKYEEDELKAIKILDNANSASGGIFQQIGLTRHIIKQALNELSHSRKHQTALCGIICATRFKYAMPGGLFSTICKKCGHLDSLSHLLKCVNLTIPPSSEDIEPTVQFLKTLAIRARNINFAAPIPLFPVLATDFELDTHTTSESEADPLEFD